MEYLASKTDIARVEKQIADNETAAARRANKLLITVLIAFITTFGTAVGAMVVALIRAFAT